MTTMDSTEMDKHLEFLLKYSREHNIIFRLTRKTASIEVLDKGDTPS